MSPQPAPPALAVNKVISVLEPERQAGDPHLAELPVRARPLLEKQWPWWGDILAHPARDAFWQQLSVIDRIEDITGR
jgi:hypothetical protein